MSVKNVTKGVFFCGVFLFFGLFLYANTASNPGFLSGLVFFPWRHNNNNGGQVVITPATIGPKINHYFMGATLTGAFPVFDQQPGFVDIWKASGVHSYDPNLLAAMNWSHWQGNYLGMLPSELASAGNTDPAMNNWANKTATTTWKHWDRFTAFMQAFGSDAKLYALGNIRTQKAGGGSIALLPTDDASNQLAITENVGMIADAKAKGLNVDKWLAGVEISDNKVRPVLNNDPQTYITRAKAVSLGVKSAHPDVKVVVGLLNPLNAAKDPFITAWNTALINSNTGANKWFDYAGIYMVMDNDENVDQTCTTGDSAVRFDCFKTITHHYTSNIPSKLDARMSAYPGYKIVVNSWGTDNNGVVPNTFSAFSVNNTIAQALFTTDFITGVMKYNAAHNNVVESMYYLNGVGDNRAAISKYDTSSDDVGNVQKIGTSMVKRTTMHVFELLASVFDGNHKLLDTNTLTIPTGIDQLDVQVLGAKDTATNKLTYIVSNWTGQSIAVQDIKVNNASIVPAGKTVQSQSIYGSALSSSYGEKNFTGTFSPVTLTALQSIQNPTSMVVRPYSVTKIVIQ